MSKEAHCSSLIPLLVAKRDQGPREHFWELPAKTCKRTAQDWLCSRSRGRKCHLLVDIIGDGSRRPSSLGIVVAGQGPSG